MTTLTSGVLAAWIGWLMLRDVPPVVAYVPALPLVVATGIAAAHA